VYTCLIYGHQVYIVQGVMLAAALFTSLH